MIDWIDKIDQFDKIVGSLQALSHSELSSERKACKMRSICCCVFFISLTFSTYGLKIPSSQIHKIRNYNDNFERLTPCVKAQLKESVDISVQDNFDYASELKRTGLWVASAAGFAGIIGATKGVDSAVEFCSGYLLEQCLSVDNLFVFIILFEYFKVTKDKQDRVLSFGIWGGTRNFSVTIQES